MKEDEDSQFSRDEDLYDENNELRAFTRKDGTTIFIKNDPNKHSRGRRRKFHQRFDDNEEVEVNLYKDLDLDNFNDFEEAE